MSRIMFFLQKPSGVAMAVRPKLSKTSQSFRDVVTETNVGTPAVAARIRRERGSEVGRKNEDTIP